VVKFVATIWFKHPEIEDGTISRGNGIYKIRSGVFRTSNKEDIDAFREQGYQEISEPERPGKPQHDPAKAGDPDPNQDDLK
jgi:hypothetical protein